MTKDVNFPQEKIKMINEMATFLKSQENKWEGSEKAFFSLQVETLFALALGAMEACTLRYPDVVDFNLLKKNVNSKIDDCQKHKLKID